MNDLFSLQGRVALAQGHQASLRLVCTASLAPYLVSRTMAAMLEPPPEIRMTMFFIA